MFLDITKDNGYLITGNEEQVSIKISGDAEQLLSKVNNIATAYFMENGISGVRVLTDNLGKDEILNEVKKCTREYAEQDLAGMTEDQLVNLLKTSREETKGLLTQELKDAYYNMRLEKINSAELEALSKYVNLCHKKWLNYLMMLCKL